MKNTRLLPILLALVMAASCDKVDDPFPAPGDGGTGPGQTVPRRVLLEEFTGHRCSTCPAAHVVAKQLRELYGDALIVVGIHATSTFAAPVDPPNPDGSYSTDFRTPAGDTYTTAFGVSFLPTGVVSRRPYNSSMTLSQGTWGSAISEIIGQEAAFDIWFSTLDHNGSANTVATQVKVAVLEPIAEAHHLTVYLLEDRVIDWQLNAQAVPPDIPDYEHRHVLRATLTDLWGMAAVPAGAQPGDTLTLDLPPFAMDPGWDAANCSVVAYMHHATNNEVMQAVERKFQP